MATKDLFVRIFGDTKDVERAFARSSKAANTFGANVDTTGKKVDRATRSFKGFATGAAAGFGGAILFNEVTTQIRAAVDVASNLAEQISKTNVVFGSSADEVKAWAETTASSIGIANDQALAAVSTFGAMFDQAGRSSDDAARLSESVVQLAADLASFNNTSVDEALNALRSGLSGEIEPLRRFQVFLTEAAVSAEALAKSGKATKDELTQGEKIMARWNLILGQTAKQQGDFARTSDGLANKQRILSAQVRDLQANLGNLLVPVLQDVTSNLTAGVAATKQLSDALQALSSVEVPPITIPIVFDRGQGGGFEIGGFTAGDALGAGRDAFIRGAEQQFPGLKFVRDLVELLKRQPTPNTKAAADAFDANFDSFLESLEKDVDKSVKRANTKLKAFGEKGFAPLKANELGANLQRQFDATVDALQLKFDKAQVTSGTADDLAALDQLEAAIRARIQTEGRTTELLRQLFAVSQERAAVLNAVSQQQAAARQASVDRILGNLGLAVDKAELTRRLDDDLSSLNALASGLRAQIRKGGDVVGLQQQLVGVVAQIADTRREIAERAAEAAQQRQFRAIGLSREGGDIIPGVDNLQKQLAQLTARLGPSLTSKMRSQLAGVAKVLKGQFGKVTAESRAAIRDLFKGIRAAFDQEIQKKIVPPRLVQVSDEVMRALGFGPDAAVNAFRGTQTNLAAKFAGVQRPVGTGTSSAAAALPPVHVHVHLDGNEVGDVLVRDFQKRAGRTTATSRGRFPGKSLGLG